jgi:hypothetical protein
MQNTSKWFTITTVTLHYLNPSQRTVEQVEHRIWSAHNQYKNITHTLNEQFEADKENRGGAKKLDTNS